MIRLFFFNITGTPGNYTEWVVGNVRLQSDSDPEAAITNMAGQAALLEGFVDFSHEVSVIGARGANGAPYTHLRAHETL